MSLILAMALAAYLGVRLWLDAEQAAHALPEFTERTAEPCGACHVNPGGGGIVNSFAPYSHDATIVPEPTGVVLFSVGLLVVGCAIRRS